MSGAIIWVLIKFFNEEVHADAFMAGTLYLNTLGYFKQVEAEEGDGRMDSTEGVAMWWQPHDIVIKLDVPGIGPFEITKADLAAPVSISFQFHDNVHLFCMYAVHTTGFEVIDGKLDLAPEQVEEVKRQLNIDERCIKFGKFAVVTPAEPFLSQLKEVLKSEGYKGRYKLVEYYDEETFHGEIPVKEIPFMKQKRFSYQREFRLCIYPRNKEEAENGNPIVIHMGDISHICTKVPATMVPGIVELKIEPTPYPPLLPKQNQESHERHSCAPL